MICVFPNKQVTLTKYLYSNSFSCLNAPICLSFSPIKNQPQFKTLHLFWAYMMGSEYWENPFFQMKTFGYTQWKPKYQYTILVTLVGTEYWARFRKAMLVLERSLFTYWGSEYWEWLSLYLSTITKAKQVGFGYWMRAGQGEPDWVLHGRSDSSGHTGSCGNLTQ